MTNKIYDTQYAPACFFRSTVLQPQMKVMLQITERCNLRCAHCFVKSKKAGGEMPIEAIQNVIMPQFIKNQVIKVTLTGGEPLIHSYAKEIVESFLNNNIGVSICTNGTLIDMEWVWQLAKYNNVHFNVSLDGFRVNSHGRFRGNISEAAFINLLETINMLGKLKLLNGILTTPNKYASIDEYMELCQFAKHAGAKYVLMNPLSPFGRGTQTQSLAYSDEEMYALKQRTLPIMSEDFEIVYIRFPNVAGLPVGKCPLGTIPYIFCDGNIAVCPYMVFAASDSKIYRPADFIVGNIFDGADLADSIKVWKDSNAPTLFNGDNNMCATCGQGCNAIKIAKERALSDCDYDLCPKREGALNI